VSAVLTKEAISPAVEGFFWIPVETLHYLGLATLDVFTRLPGSKTPTLLCGSSTRLGENELQQIAEHGYTNVLIRRNDLGRLSEAIQHALAHLLSDAELTLEVKFILLQIASWQRLDHDGRRLYSERFLETAQVVGMRIADLLGEDEILASDLYAHSLGIDCVPVHLTNVAAYCVLLAREMGIEDRDQLAKIAVGAMLHDFGKLFLPQDVLQKTGRLSVQERELVEQYPQLGFEELCDRDDLEFGQLMMVYQHQERFDGSGYPVAIENDEIHPWARILAVADVFDSLTSTRPYRRGNSVADALLYLADNASKQFDPKAVLCWITIFPQQ
jgi:HD-GYP domain-containing protein (c-di-GMP phosphodiesterase class II)